MSEFLLSNIRQQMSVMQEMDKKPTKLVCDPDSFDVLFGELKPNLSLLYLREQAGRMTVYGLEIEFSREPNFEVR